MPCDATCGLGITLCEVSALIYAGGICVQRFGLTLVDKDKLDEQRSVTHTDDDPIDNDATDDMLSFSAPSNGSLVTESSGDLFPTPNAATTKEPSFFSRPQICCMARHNFIWLGGLTIYTFANVLFTLALGMGPLALMTSLFVTVLVFNAIFATLFLKEKLRSSDKVGCVLIMLGIVMCGVFIDKSSKEYTADDLAELMAHPEPGAIVYLICIVLILFGLTFSIYQLEKEYPDWSVRKPPATELVKAHIKYPCLLAMYESIVQILLKGSSDMLLDTVKGNSQLGSWVFYVFLLGIAIDGVFIVWWLRKAYARFEAVKLLPIQMGMLTTSSVLGGLSFYQEYAEMSTLDLAMTFCGLFFILSGIFTMYAWETIYVKMRARRSAIARRSHLQTDSLNEPLMTTESSPPTPRYEHERGSTRLHVVHSGVVHSDVGSD